MIQIMQDLERYEALICEAADVFEKTPAVSAHEGIAVKFLNEAKAIRAKQKKEGR